MSNTPLVNLTPSRYADPAIAAVGKTSPQRGVGATRIEINLFDTNAFITAPIVRSELKESPHAPVILTYVQVISMKGRWSSAIT
jgi:hypothetical protein